MSQTTRIKTFFYDLLTAIIRNKKNPSNFNFHYWDDIFLIHYLNTKVNKGAQNSNMISRSWYRWFWITKKVIFLSTYGLKITDFWLDKASQTIEAWVVVLLMAVKARLNMELNCISFQNIKKSWVNSIKQGCTGSKNSKICEVY